MPRIWIMYTEVLENQHKISKTRAVFNWSFRNLPLTQHEKIWKKFSLWAMKLDNSSTALSVIPRYIKLNPDFKEQFSDYLLERKMYNKAVEVILQILKDDGYHSKAKKSKKDF
jgi:pre-mRNA-splicing factor SYF1